ncbi:hypothetical protein J4Q44_G00019610 [Coregonus suidteri]|uniref:Uncharacterized protein n=1 Tax=Coregonus suidteri TaxID=861788 RepID=A0AAN8R5V0_9TELE
MPNGTFASLAKEGTPCGEQQLGLQFWAVPVWGACPGLQEESYRAPALQLCEDSALLYPRGVWCVCDPS